MSRSVVLACLCALPFAGLIRQAEAAETLAATLDERNRPGAAIDPIDAPRDSLGDSLIRSAPALDQPDSPSFLDGLLPLPRLDLGVSAAHGLLRESASHAPPPSSTLRRLSRIQVFRN
jgi:hypothetical protein